MKNFLRHISLSARKASFALLEELCSAGTALLCRNGFALASGLSTARKASFALLEELCSVRSTLLCAQHTALRALLCALALCSIVLTGCQDNDAPYNVLVDSMGSGIVAFKQDPIALSRTACNNEDQEHVNSTPRHENRFIPGTKYLIWGYKDKGTSTGVPNHSDPIFAGQPIEGLESPTHYVELSPANKKKLQGEMHIYGMTNNTVNCNETLPSAGAAGYPSFDLAPVDGLSDLWGYYDLCRGYVHYDPATTIASSFDLPFTHVMSQVKVSVIQEGEVTSTTETDPETGQETVIYTGEVQFNIFLKSIKLYNEIPTAKYHAINDTYDYSGTTRTDNQHSRLIYKNNDANSVNGYAGTYNGKKIPFSNDDDPTTNIEAISLLVPQRWDSEGVNSYDFNAEWNPTGDPKSDFNDAVWLELTISGPDAWKFDNEYQESENNEGDVIVRLPIKDNTLASNNPLEFLPNHAYNLVVVFHGDNVHVVTLRPLLYPWFDGESEGEVKGDKYQNSDMGSPMVFGSVQWNDRYMGSDFVNPKNLEEFIKATGFYYQKDRSIPFYPSIYTGGYVYDIYGNIHDLEYAEQNSGQTVTIDGITYATGGQKVLFRAGGHWTDPTPAQMLNYPKVYPIVSYYLPPYQYFVDGTVDNHEDNYPATTCNSDLYNKYIEDKHDWRYDKYCALVDDYYDRTTGEIRTFTKGEERIDYMMRYIANMEDNSNHMWETNTETHPCPPGWRLPTKDELFSIFPSTPVAGNITFLSNFRVQNGSIGNDHGNNKENGLPGKEIYVQIPYKKYTDMYPPLHKADGSYSDVNYGAEIKWTDNIPLGKPDHKYNKSVCLPEYDPEPKDVTQYVISKRHFTEGEFNNTDSLSAADKAKIPGNTEEEKLANYLRYKGHVFYGQPVNPPPGSLGHHETFIDREWGTIYAIKKQGTVDAYRMRWHVERVVDGLDVYNLVIDKYKCSEYDKLEYDFSHMGQNDGFYLDYDWDHPESTLYFPITGLVADDNMAQYLPTDGAEQGAAMVYNYGTETIILTQDHIKDFVVYEWSAAENKNVENTYNYAAAYRIKIAGTNSYSLYLYPSMERLAQGGQVRPVRTYRK